MIQNTGEGRTKKRVTLVTLACLAAMLCTLVAPSQSDAQGGALFCNAPYVLFGSTCRITNPGTDPATIVAWRCPPTSEEVEETPVVFGGVSYIQECNYEATPDGDGVPTAIDNCPNIWNVDQRDGDSDGIGDPCDLPPDVAVVPGNRSEGTPLSYSGCVGGIVFAEVEGLVFAMNEVNAGEYELQLNPAIFPDGEYIVVVDAECPADPDESERVVFAAEISYLDPSGFILSQIGQPLSGATVTLFYSPTELTDPNDADFVSVPPGSAIMSEANRANPVVTGDDGFYKWDTVAGWYVVSATVPGCMNPDETGAEVRSAVLPVPPEQFNVNLIFNCDALPTCNGLTVTMAAIAGVTATGTPNADVILGSPGDDVIDGRGGNDTVCAGGGDDIVLGGDGDDTVFGGDGNDKIWGGDGGDTINGDAGEDRIRGQAGDDTIHGGADRDVILGNEGVDTINGDGGRDSLFGGDDNDTINGGDDTDLVRGEGGDDMLFSGPSGNDRLVGGDGNDTLDARATSGSTRLIGDGGNDLFYGSAQLDRMWGYGGNDTMFAGNFNDLLRGGDGNDVINGEDGRDTLDGGPGDDILNGGPGNADKMVGLGGNDTCNGGPGNHDFAHSTCETILAVP